MKTLACEQQQPSIKTPILTLFGLWIIYLVLLALLQKLGFQFGFRVWPMGEDRNFLGFMDKASGAKIAHEFWNVNDRNPMAVWWWIWAEPIIRNYNCGLYLVRKLIDPFLAISTFLMLDQLGRKQFRTFASTVAIMVLLWNISSYFEQINWDFLGALGTSLLTIYFYCRYFDSGRSKSRNLGIALILYLFTITTYTLHVGAIIAITCIAFFRKSHFNETIPLYQKIWNGLWDVAFFAAIFIIYNCIWYTASRNADIFYVFDWTSFYTQFLSSIEKFIYHPAYTMLLQMTLRDFSLSNIVLIFGSAFLFFLFVFFKFPGQKIFNANQKIPIFWVISVMLSLTVSIIILESTSSIWFPGSRSVMVQQVWQPLLYVSVIFLVVNLLPWISAASKHFLILIVVALLGAYIVLLGLEYNYSLVMRTYYQRNLADGILKLGVPVAESPTYLVKLINVKNNMDTIPIVISVYGSTMLHQPVNLRVLTHDPNPEHDPYWATRFEENAQGAFNAGAIENAKATPYQNLWIIFFDGEKVWVPEKVDKEDFKGLQVQWNRTTPIDQADKAKRMRLALGSA